MVYNFDDIRFRRLNIQPVLMFRQRSFSCLKFVQIFLKNIHFKYSYYNMEFPKTSLEKTIPPELIYPGPFIFFLWS